MTVSELATVHIPSPNRYAPRAFPVTKITPHHMGGNLTVESCGGIFENPSRGASSNYGIGSDGRIACYVDEDDAAWTSSNWDNDNRAITFEIADYDTDDWSPTQAAWDSVVNLCVDICQRYGIQELIYTGGPDGNLTEHMMFSNTACPGPWWHANMPRLAEEVNFRLKGGSFDMTECLFYCKDDHYGYYAGDIVYWNPTAGFCYLEDIDCINLIRQCTPNIKGIDTTSDAPWIYRAKQATNPKVAAETFGKRE